MNKSKSQSQNNINIISGQQQQKQKQQSQENIQSSSENQCEYHPCRTKYFCIEPDCEANKRIACGECYTESPHNLHKIIKNEEYETILKANYEKISKSTGTVENTQSLLKRVKDSFSGLKERIIKQIDMAEQHVNRELIAKQDLYETEKFKNLIQKSKKLKHQFFMGGISSFDKTIGDFSLDIYNMDENLVNYVQTLKEHRENYINPFLQQFKIMQQGVEDFIHTSIAPIYHITPDYPMDFEPESLAENFVPLEGHTDKFNYAQKFIYNQQAHREQQLDKTSLSLASNHNFVFTAAQDNSLRLWNLGCDSDQIQQPQLWKTFLFQNKNVLCLAQLDYSTVLTGCSDGVIQLWNVSDASCIMKFSHLDQAKKEDKKNPKSQESLSQQAKLKMQSNPDRVCSLTQINESVVSAGYSDGTIRFWDVKKGEVLQQIHFYDNQDQEIEDYLTPSQLEKRAINKIFKINQWTIITTGLGQDPQKSQNNLDQQQQPETGDQEVIKEISLDESQQQIQRKTNNNIDQNKNKGTEDEFQGVVIYDWNQNSKLVNYNGHRQNKITDLIRVNGPLGQGGWGVSADSSFQIHIWDIYTAKLLKVFDEHIGTINSLIPLGDTIFASGGDDLTVKIWNIESIKIQDQSQLQEENENSEQDQDQENSSSQQQQLDEQVYLIKDFQKLVPKNEQQNQNQMVSTKKNYITFMERITEKEILVGCSQSPYIYILK